MKTIDEISDAFDSMSAPDLGTDQTVRAAIVELAEARKRLDALTAACEEARKAINATAKTSEHRCLCCGQVILVSIELGPALTTALATLDRVLTK